MARIAGAAMLESYLPGASSSTFLSDFKIASYYTTHCRSGCVPCYSRKVKALFGTGQLFAPGPMASNIFKNEQIFGEKAFTTQTYSTRTILSQGCI